MTRDEGGYEPWVELVDGGLEKVPEFLEAVRRVFGRDLARAEVERIPGLPSEHVGRTKLKLQAVGLAVLIKGTVSDDIGPTMITEQRFLATERGLVAHLDLIWVRARQHPRGTGKRTVLRQLDALVDLGAVELRLEAAWVGQYLWPRAGFELVSPDLEEIKLVLAGWLFKHREFPSMEQALAAVEPVRTLSEIVSAPFGRDFLEWRGYQQSCAPFKMVLSLRDPTSVAYLDVRAFLAGRSPAK